MKIIVLFILISLISCKRYEFHVNRDIIYSQLGDEERKIKFRWNEFGISKEDIITKVEVEIFTKKIKIGRWQGEFGTSINIDPFWFSSGNIQQELCDNTGVITWDVGENIGAHIADQPEGQFLFTIWWIDCDSFSLKKIIIHTT